MGEMKNGVYQVSAATTYYKRGDLGIFPGTTPDATLRWETNSKGTAYRVQSKITGRTLLHFSIANSGKRFERREDIKMRHKKALTEKEIDEAVFKVRPELRIGTPENKALRASLGMSVEDRDCF